MSDQNTSLPVRTQTEGDVAAKICDGTTPSQQLAVDSSGKIIAKLNDSSGVGITSQASGGQQPLDVGVNVGGVQVDPRAVRALTNTDVVTVELNDGAGTSVTVGQKAMAASLPVVIASDQSKIDVNLFDEAGAAYSPANPLPVSVGASAGTPIHDYKKASAIAKDATDDHDYSVASGNTFSLEGVLISASGKFKAELQIGDGAVSEVFASKVVRFNSTAEPNADIDFFRIPISVLGTANTTTVKLILTNLDNQAQDLYSTFIGKEV